MTEQFNLADFEGSTKVTSEFSVVCYYNNGEWEIFSHSYDTVEDAVDKARDILAEDKEVKRVNIVYLATAWDGDYIAETIVEEDIMGIVR